MIITKEQRDFVAHHINQFPASRNMEIASVAEEVIFPFIESNSVTLENVANYAVELRSFGINFLLKQLRDRGVGYEVSDIMLMEHLSEDSVEGARIMFTALLEGTLQALEVERLQGEYSATLSRDLDNDLEKLLGA